jgi:hypothetical protein
VRGAARKGGPYRDLVFGLAAWLAANVTAPKRFAWRVPGRSRWRRGLGVGLAVGLAASVAFGVMAGLDYGLTTGLQRGLMFGTGVGLLVGFMSGRRTNAADRLALGQDARRVIHDDLVAALSVGLMAGLAVGLVFGLMVGLVFGLMVGLAFVLTFALNSGLVFGVLAGLTVGRHATASLVFAFTEIFPARPVQFLEWARNAGLLRVTGIAYQCRHDSYQQWLAAGAVGRGVKTTLDAPRSKAPWLILGGIALLGVIALAVVLVIGLRNFYKSTKAGPEQTATGCTPKRVRR